jgi:hypothetical protein
MKLALHAFESGRAADQAEAMTALRAALLITPRSEWVSLTDEEIAEIASTPCAVVGSYVHTFARAIETELKEQNT